MSRFNENMVMGSGNGLCAIAVLVSPNNKHEAVTTQIATLLNMVGQRFESVKDEDDNLMSAHTDPDGTSHRIINVEGVGNIIVRVIPSTNTIEIDGSNLAPDVWKTITVGDDSVDAEGIDDELQFVGSNGVNVTLNTTAKTITISGAALETAINNLSTSKQDKSDNGLNTTSKQIVGAINEVLAAITSESNTRTAADTTLDGKITAEIQRAQGVETSLNAAIATKIGDAPSDGNEYARKNGQWAKIEGGGGGGIPEAPKDGKQYARKDGNWSEVQAEDLGLSIANGKLCITYTE